MSLALSEEQLAIISAIFAEHLPRARVRAFGSRVKGSARRYSDLDLAVDNGDPLSLSQHADLVEAFSESDLPFKVDVVDWRSASPGFQAIIDRDGVDLTTAAGGG